MLQRTNLAWDPYYKYLERVITGSKSTSRAEIKPMMTPKGAGEPHLTSRATHERLAADIIEEIARELGLNAEYAYIGMLFHDAGHPFSAHDGEEFFDLIGRVENCGFYHHNAKGVETILAENICEQAINMIPGIENNPELRKKLEEEFYYYLDIVVSHDGEATKSDINKETTPYPTIKEAVMTKLCLANATGTYKFIAQTDEGKLAKIADVLAYLPTDIQDGFRLSGITGFNEDYLELIGSMFAEDETLDDNGKREFAKQFITEIQGRKLRELESDMTNPLNQEILGYAIEIRREAKNQGLNISALSDEERDKLDQIIESKIQKIRREKHTSTYEEEQKQYSNENKLREFTSKILNLSSATVAEITSKIREYFISDFIKTSREKQKLTFSLKAEDLFYKLKRYNGKYIVTHLKFDYQRVGQPDAAKELVNDVAQSLVKSGAIRDKFYDEAIMKEVEKLNPKAATYMKSPQREEATYDEYKKKVKIITGRKTLEGKYEETDPKKLHKYKLFKDVYSYTRKHGQSFARKYVTVFEAIPYTVRKNVEFALENKNEKTDFLQEYQQENNDNIRNRMIKRYGSIEAAKEHNEEFIAELVEEERNKMEEKMAKQLAIDYLSGMTDRGFNAVAIKTGYMTYEQVWNGSRGGTSQSVSKLVAALERAEQDTGLEL